MMWLIVLIFLLAVGMVSIGGRSSVPWADKMRRVNAGVARRAEWIAPPETVEAVRKSYLRAISWMSYSIVTPCDLYWAEAPRYLSGLQLKRHQKILRQYCTGRSSRFVGVMHADHQVDVRQFSEDGERCLIVDVQTNRSVTTRDYVTLCDVNQQALDDCTAVYEMSYDRQERRWKIDRFVQDLPVGWNYGKESMRKVKLRAALPSRIARDH